MHRGRIGTPDDSSLRRRESGFNIGAAEKHRSRHYGGDWVGFEGWVDLRRKFAKAGKRRLNKDGLIAVSIISLSIIRIKMYLLVLIVAALSFLCAFASAAPLERRVFKAALRTCTDTYFKGICERREYTSRVCYDLPSTVAGKVSSARTTGTCSLMKSTCAEFGLPPSAEYINVYYKVPMNKMTEGYDNAIRSVYCD
ncbi:hypothetical protein NA57DRAFT_81119 [Rhizodiscina lignyota]|uniref:Uncharacterized protein n=1 Tax=Rhizodiscina lignyota TaxID=1504668 RepID=A0A9P4I517_9PEZI|nr:hypothetical protein NA57DRAFT_81119 [Rhizodiscina lignyota]